MKTRLTPKQAAFVAEYLVDLNATQAAIRAGYSKRTAYRIASELLQKTSVSEALQTAMRERAKRTEITADRVLEQYARLAFADVRQLFQDDGTLKPMSEWPDDAAAMVNGIEVVELDGDPPGRIKKLKLVDKRASLADIAKHLGMLKEHVEVAGELEISWKD